MGAIGGCLEGTWDSLRPQGTVGGQDLAWRGRVTAVGGTGLDPDGLQRVWGQAWGRLGCARSLPGAGAL